MILGGSKKGDVEEIVKSILRDKKFHGRQSSNERLREK